MRSICSIVAAAAMLSLASPAISASLKVTDISAAWSSTTPRVDGIGSPEIRWGRPAETRRSGYNFTSTSIPFEVQDQSQFVIGQFKHENFPVFETFLRAANLAVEFSVVGISEPIRSVFAFSHLETLNDPGNTRCPNGAANGVGVNIAGCADRVRATLNREHSDTVEIGGVTYVFDVIGFQRSGATLTDFWTEENRSNSAELVAIFRVVEDEPISEVPLPASGTLALAALASLISVRRRR